MNTDVGRTPRPGGSIQCEVSDIWHVLGRAWALVVLKNMDAKEPVRFNDLRRLIPGISSTVLSERLKELEREGLISKKVYAEIPSRVEYSLTKPARELESILEDLGRWVARWKPAAAKAK